MATGDQADLAARLRSMLPLRWFPAPPGAGEAETAPVLNGLLQGFGAILALPFALLAFVRAQMRLATASGSNLDLIAIDYFGAAGLPRQANEPDAAYATRIQASRFPKRNTRAAILAAVQQATGQTVQITVAMRAADTKGYGSAASPAAGGGYGYGTAGLRYGTRSRQGQAFIEAPAGTDPNALATAVLATRPAGTVCWLRIL